MCRWVEIQTGMNAELLLASCRLPAGQAGSGRRSDGWLAGGQPRCKSRRSPRIKRPSKTRREGAGGDARLLIHTNDSHKSPAYWASEPTAEVSLATPSGFWRFGDRFRGLHRTPASLFERSRIAADPRLTACHPVGVQRQTTEQTHSKPRSTQESAKQTWE